MTAIMFIDVYKRQSQMFASMDDDYMKARAADIKDISERLVRNLSGQEDADLSDIDPSAVSYTHLIKETSILGYVGILDLTKASSYVSSRTYQMFLPLAVADRKSVV